MSAFFFRFWHLPLFLLVWLFPGIPTAHAQHPGATWAADWKNRIDLELNAGKLPGADSLLTIALDSARLVYGPQSDAVADLLDLARVVSQYQGNQRGMESAARAALDIRLANHGLRDRRTALGQIQLATVFYFQSRRDSTELLLQAALDVLHDLALDNSSERMDGISILGLYYQRQGRLLKAEPLLLEALQLEQTLHSDTTMNYSAGCNNLGSLYAAMERFELSAQYYERSLELVARNVGREHADYALTLKNLANACRRWGKLERAEALASEALAIARRVLPPGHPDFVQYCWAVSDVKEALGQNKATLPFLQEAYELVLQAYGARSWMANHALNKLGIYYANEEDHQQAESYYRQALALLDTLRQSETEQYAAMLCNVGRVKKSMKQLEEAITYLRRGRDLAQRLLGPQEVRVFYKYNYYLVLAYLQAGMPDSAWALVEPFESIVAQTYGETSRRMSEWSLVAGLCRVVMNDPDRGVAYLRRSLACLQREAAVNLSFLSFAEKESYLAFFDEFNRHISGVGHAFTGHGAASGLLYDLALFRKEMLVGAESKLLRRWRQTEDTALRAQLLEYYSLRQQQIALESRPLAQRQELTELKARIAAKEKPLARELGLALTDAQPAPTTWQQVQAVLKPGEVAVEFLLLPARPGLPSRYAALVLRPGEPAPVLVLLGDAAAVERSLAGAGTRALSYAENLYGRGPGGRELYALVWRPLAARLAGVRRIYLAPVGPLHQLNFRALPTGESTSYLGDQYELVLLTSTRRLTEPDFAAPPPSFAGPVLLFGGLHYEADGAAGNTKPPSPGAQAPDRGGSDGWLYLPETLREIQAIDSLLRGRAPAITTHTGIAGTEARLRAACRPGHSPAILHLATHGFFFQAGPSDAGERMARPGFLYAQNPMLRSGLILAGANPAWRASALPIQADNDGILTAEEVSLLGLDHTALVVLSACETGLGEPRNYEGIYGLQRAFRVAGARALVMTLWRMPDEPTRAFMVDFYARLAAGTTVQTAFNEAVRAQRERYGAAYYWAGFILY